MFGIRNPHILQMRMRRRRQFERRRRGARKKFWPLRHTLGSRRKGKLYGRRLRQARTWMFVPRWWYVGHRDWPQNTREYERGMLSVKPDKSSDLQLEARPALNSGSVETSSMWAAETLKEWHDFYVLMGTAGATLACCSSRSRSAPVI